MPDTTPAPEPVKVTEAPKVKTYTEADIRAIQAAKDKEIATRDAELQKIAFQRQMEQMQQQEARAEAQDKAYIESGVLTEQDAAQRKQLRIEMAQQRMQYIRDQQMHQELLRQSEASAYEIHADRIVREICQEEGLDDQGRIVLMREVMSGDRAKTVAELEARAERIVRKAFRELRKINAVKPESYDKGPASVSTGGNLDNMSPQQKIQWALQHQK